MDVIKKLHDYIVHFVHFIPDLDNMDIWTVQIFHNGDSAIFLLFIRLNSIRQSLQRLLISKPFSYSGQPF